MGIPEDMTLAQYIKMKLDERFIEMHMREFGIHPNNCAHCLNRGAEDVR